MVITAPEYTKNLLLLLIRIIIGVSFIVAAKNKGRDIRKFANKNGLPVPAAVIVMCVEFVSAAALLAGFYTQIAAAAIMFLMLGTLRLHIFKWHSPYWADKGGWEYDLIMFTLAAVILVFGSGSVALIK